MTGLNVEWAIGELDKFIEMTVLRNNSFSGNGVTFIDNTSSTAASDGDVAKQAQVVEKILDRVIPRWRTEIELRRRNRWTRHREAAIRAKTELEREEEIRVNLGDDAPELSAAKLHPWVWAVLRHCGNLDISVKPWKALFGNLMRKLKISWGGVIFRRRIFSIRLLVNNPGL